MTEYILFVIQDANFCPKSLLIPYQGFLEKRKEDHDLLIKYAQKNVSFSEKGTIVVPNLLINNIVWTGNSGTSEKTPYLPIINNLLTIAEWGPEEFEGFERCIFPREVNGFNPLLIFQQLMKKYPSIVESFLVLETDNRKSRYVPYDTVEEMYDDLYHCGGK